MAESIVRRVSSISDSTTQRDLIKLLNAAQADLADLRAAVVTLTAKLDADAGVTDTNYGTTVNIAASAVNLIK